MGFEKHTLKAAYSYQSAVVQSDLPVGKSQYRRTISYDDASIGSVKESLKELPLILPLHLTIPIVEPTIPTANHRAIKTSRQRCRWNLVFNLLVWIICPLPLWLPFLSNEVALFLLPSIQGIFILIWLIISLLAARNACILFR